MRESTVASQTPETGKTTQVLAEQRHSARWILVGAAILTIGFNLRTAPVALSPVLAEVMATTGMTASSASMLSMMQLICFGGFAAVGPMLSRRLGLERAALLVMVFVTIGLALRGLGWEWTIWLGGFFACAAIGAGNVVMPSLIKRDFSDRIALASSFYTMAVCLGGTVPLAATAPLRIVFHDSWAWAMEFWALPSLLTLGYAAWLWRAAPPPSWAEREAARGSASATLWFNPLAWNVTIYMGLQSLIAYSAITWLAPILRDRGESAVNAGLVSGYMMIVQVVFSLPLPMFAARLKRQSWPATISFILNVGGFLGLIYGDAGLKWIFATVMGIGMGGCFGIAVLMMVMRAPNAAVAARLSAMVQTGGYVIASLGPLLIGVLHDMTGDWRGVAAVMIFTLIAGSINGFLAGRPSHVKG
jgi:MFS transporter, CP family, cyanate transporter